jgi:hypothetical protein
MLSIQAILVTSSLLMIVGMLASLAWLSALRRSTDPIAIEQPENI